MERTTLRASEDARDQLCGGASFDTKMEGKKEPGKKGGEKESEVDLIETGVCMYVMRPSPPSSSGSVQTPGWLEVPCGESEEK